MSVTEESIVSIKNEIYDLIGSTNFETVTVPINCHFCGTHSVKHERLEIGKCVSHLCFVHDAIFAQIAADLNPSCDTLPTGRAADWFVTLLPPSFLAWFFTFLQKFGVVVFNLSNEFIYRILIKMI